MFRQGDKERSLHLPLSPLADRTRKGVTQMQVSRPRWAGEVRLGSLASHGPVMHRVGCDAPCIGSHLPCSCLPISAQLCCLGLPACSSPGKSLPSSLFPPPAPCLPVIQVCLSHTLTQACLPCSPAFSTLWPCRCSTPGRPPAQLPCPCWRLPSVTGRAGLPLTLPRLPRLPPKPWPTRLLQLPVLTIRPQVRLACVPAQPGSRGQGRTRCGSPGCLVFCCLWVGAQTVLWPLAQMRAQGGTAA